MHLVLNSVDFVITITFLVTVTTEEAIGKAL